MTIFLYISRDCLLAVKGWLEDGNDINIQDCYGVTPLMDSAIYGRFDISKLFIKKGANLNIQKQHGYTALMQAINSIIRELETLKMVKLLVEKGADIEVRDNHGETALMKAARRNYHSVTKYLIYKGANINIKTSFGYTALMTAALYGYHETVEFLVQKGSKINQRNKYGETALRVAQEGPQYAGSRTLDGRMKIVKYLNSLKGPLSLQHIILNLIEIEGISHANLPEILFER